MSAAVAQPLSESRMPVDREAVAYVLAGWSGCSIEQAVAMLPPHLDREVVRAHAASWLEDLALRPTAERIDALVMMGVRRASFGRTRLNRNL